MAGLVSLMRVCLLALCAGGLVATQSVALPLAVPAQEASGLDTNAAAVLPVASDCYAVGQQVAQQNGGTLAKASPATRGGKPVCVIVVLVPGKEGERPRRAEIVVPQG